MIKDLKTHYIIFVILLVSILGQKTPAFADSTPNAIIFTDENGYDTKEFKEPITSELKPGMTVSFEGTEYKLGPFLGRGNSHIVFEISGQPELAIRIPVSLHHSFATVNTEFTYGMEVVKKLGVPTVEIINSSSSHIIVKNLGQAIELRDLTLRAHDKYSHIFDKSMKALEVFLIKMGNISATGDGTQILYTPPSNKNPIGKWVLADIFTDKNNIGIENEGYARSARDYFDSGPLETIHYALRSSSFPFTGMGVMGMNIIPDKMALKIEETYKNLVTSVARTRGASEQEISEYLKLKTKRTRSDYNSLPTKKDIFFSYRINGADPENIYETLQILDSFSDTELRLIMKRSIKHLSSALKNPSMKINERTIKQTIFLLNFIKPNSKEWSQLVKPINKIIPLLQVGSIPYRNLQKLLVDNSSDIKDLGSPWVKKHPDFFNTEETKVLSFTKKESKVKNVIRTCKLIFKLN